MIHPALDLKHYGGTERVNDEGHQRIHLIQRSGNSPYSGKVYSSDAQLEDDDAGARH